MSDQPTPPPEPTSSTSANVTSGGDVTVGGDVAGRDVVKSTTTNVGFSAKDVQRLVITVGVIVFVTAGVFFSGGIALGAAIVSFNKDVGSSRPAGAAMAARIAALPKTPGSNFELDFTEDEISSYVKFEIGEDLGFAPETGKVRLYTEGDTPKLAVYGQLAEYNNLPVVAEFVLQKVPGQPFKLNGAAAQFLQVDGSPFGWVAVPTNISQVQEVAVQLNKLLGNVTFNEIRDVTTNPQNFEWSVSGHVR